MKNLRNILLATITLVLIGVVAIFFAWNNIDSRTILRIIKKETSALKKNGILIEINHLAINKHFPIVGITVQSIKASYKSKAQVNAQNVKISVSLPKIIIAKLLSKPYIGTLHISKLDAIIKNNSNSQLVNPRNIRIPILPANLFIKKVTIKYENIDISGNIKTLFNQITNSNFISFAGKINSTYLKALIHTNENSISVKSHIQNLNLKHIYSTAKEISIKALYRYGKHISLFVKAKECQAHGINLINPSLTLKANINNYPQIELESFTLTSSNGYKINIKGKTNISNPKNTKISGIISTGFIYLSQLLLPKKIEGYIEGGKIKIQNLTVNGKLSVKAIKSGLIIVNNIKFRIDKKTAFFHIDNATAEISPTKIKLSGSGSFDQMYSPKSTLVIYRKENYPADMHIYFHGQATELVRVFLERDILSNGDVKLLGTTSDLKGNVKANIDIFYYRWGPKPYFNFTMRIHSNGVSLKNSNIPNEYIKTFGDLTIERIVKNGRIKLLYIDFSNFKAITRTSTFFTKHLRLTLSPQLGFNGDYNLKISYEDLYELARNAFKATLPVNLKEIETKGTLNGTIKDLSIKSNTLVYFKKGYHPIKVDFHCFLKYPTLKVLSLYLNGIGRLKFSGDLNIKERKLTQARIKASNLKIESIRRIIKINKNFSGILNGVVSFRLKNGTPIFENSTLTIDNATVYILKNVHATINLDNTTLKIEKAAFNLFSNTFNAQGTYNLNNRKANVFLTAKQVAINLEQILPKSKFKNLNYSIHIPPYLLNADALIGNLKLINKGMEKSFGRVRMLFINSKKILKIALTSKTTAYITYTKPIKTIRIDIKDRVIWPIVTKCKDKRTILKIRGTLKTPKTDYIDIKTIYGRVKFTAKHGYLSHAPSAVNILALLNPFETLIKGVEPRKIEYSKIYADVEIKNGILRVSQKEPAFLKGNINIFGYGELNIMKKKVNAYVTFVTLSTLNRIISKIPIIGWIITGKMGSFTGLSFHIKGDITKPKIKPIPFKSLAKGILGIIKRTIVTPFKIFGVE